MIVNKALLESVIAGANALRTAADEVRKDPQYKEQSGAGHLLRLGTEDVLQKADLLEGWAKRNGWNPDE